MKTEEIVRKVDHTLLKQDATLEQIKELTDEAIEFGAASICIPPAYVKDAYEYVRGRVPICTVIGFPNGYSTTDAKVFETADAVCNGADEIDMVVNLGMVKNKKWDEVLNEIKAVREACSGGILKVIIETCLLTREEKIRLCRIVSEAGADYIKTSTGFSIGGATREDVALLREHIAPNVKVKASGGIRTMEEAETYIELGADRIGASAIVKSLKK